MVYKNMEYGFGLYRKIDGKKFRRYETTSSPSMAKKTAKSMRKEGHTVRVIQNAEGYFAVYIK